ncbi:MAG: tripartite tricarboxylate transporter substrate binding protein [Betaproteobacteria bacterium]|nr:tripartite tricarboxylate transporter substrate binding protein [Betaproteobacteria bacterium]MBI2291892.1 tripartite tricarboxylate transporter substrate binding protein [Betaproteobacteria bacterium]MBI3053571.1 tripartite tricarboxylate transporter substrate binding protein [Betaproteobacteria bacterium]
MKTRLTGVALAAACLLDTAGAWAAYPEKPIRIIVPYAPGGNIDVNARIVAPALTERLGQPVVVENRGGAGSRIGTEMAAKAAPDGYTLLLGSSGSLTINPVFSPNATIDPLRDFSYTSLISNVPMVLSVHPSVPARSVKEFIALAKSRPERLTMGSAGVGSNTHFTGELFQLETAIKLVHVPYKGTGPALIELMGGQVDLIFDQLSTSISLIKSGRLRPLGVTTLKRSFLLPAVPTIDESGVRGFEASSYTGIMLPSATPKDIVMKIYEALTNWLDQPAARESFARLGADVIKTTPEEAARRIRDDVAKWTKVREATGISLK